MDLGDPEDLRRRHQLPGSHLPEVFPVGHRGIADHPGLPPGRRREVHLRPARAYRAIVPPAPNVSSSGCASRNRILFAMDPPSRTPRIPHRGRRFRPCEYGSLRSYAHRHTGQRSEAQHEPNAPDPALPSSSLLLAAAPPSPLLPTSRSSWTASPCDARGIAIRGEVYLPAWILENYGGTKVEWVRPANLLQINTASRPRDPVPVEGTLKVKVGSYLASEGFVVGKTTRLFLLNTDPKALPVPRRENRRGSRARRDDRPDRPRLGPRRRIPEAVAHGPLHPGGLGRGFPHAEGGDLRVPRPRRAVRGAVQSAVLRPTDQPRAGDGAAGPGIGRPRPGAAEDRDPIRYPSAKTAPVPSAPPRGSGSCSAGCFTETGKSYGTSRSSSRGPRRRAWICRTATPRSTNDVPYQVYPASPCSERSSPITSSSRETRSPMSLSRTFSNT